MSSLSIKILSRVRVSDRIGAVNRKASPIILTEPLEAAALFHHRRFPLGCVIIKGLNRFRRIPSGFVSMILRGYIQVAIFNNLPAVHPS